MVYIGADHAGFEMKEELKKFFRLQKIAFEDMGATTLNANDDYPEYARAVAKKVSESRGRAKGVLLCGNAQGVCIVANKHKGIRAVTGYSEYAATTARQDDDANILCLAGRVISAASAKRIVRKFLSTNFSEATRHRRRLRQIQRLEVQSG